MTVVNAALATGVPNVPVITAAKASTDHFMMDASSQFDLSHELYMRQALREAAAASAEDEVPIGAIVVRHDPTGGDDRVIGAAHNQREQLHDPTAHAEMLAITQAAEALGNWRLEHCTLYVTLEPCPMCAGAIVLARIPRVVYGAADPKAGAARTLYQILDDARLNHRAEVVAGVLGEECGLILSQFFSRRRQGSKEEGGRRKGEGTDDGRSLI